MNNDYELIGDMLNDIENDFQEYEDDVYEEYREECYDGIPFEYIDD